jgi:hypothetical protein
MAYVDDIIIIDSSLVTMKEAFQLPAKTRKEVGLVVNKGKTKYTQLTAQFQQNPHH